MAFSLRCVGEIGYNKEQKIGSGEIAKVYKGIFERRDVAVKKIFCKSNKEFERWDNEVKILLDCDSHDNIVKYHKKEIDDDFIYIALELCGGNLQQWMENKIDGISTDAISNIEILHQTTKGLHHLHEKRIIHRDLKPQNILLVRINKIEIRVKIADFGISRKIPDGKTSVTLTRTGMAAIEWRSPEILNFESGNPTAIQRLSTATDIFSLGCIIYYVLTNGKHPFGDDAGTQEANIRNNTPLMDLDQFLPPHLLGNLPLILDMMAENKNDRPLTNCILNHPLLWSNKKLLQFLSDIGVVFEDYKSDIVTKVKEKLQDQFSVITEDSFPLEDGWLGVTRTGSRPTLCSVVQGHLKNYEYRKGKPAYDGTNILHLYRAIYNLKKHAFHGTMPTTVKTALGPDHIVYWLTRFPFLVSTLWIACNDLRGTDCWHTIDQYYM